MPPEEQEKFDALPDQYTHLYLAIAGVLAAVICISDPLRPEAKEVIDTLRALGIRKTVMLTGDSERTAAAIAAQVGANDYRSEVLPEDKSKLCWEQQAQGRVVVMLGRMGSGPCPLCGRWELPSVMVRPLPEIADITISADNLEELVTLRRISMALMKRIQSNYRFVIGFNGSLIGLQEPQAFAPATSASHCTSFYSGRKSMTNLLDHDS